MAHVLIHFIEAPLFIYSFFYKTYISNILCCLMRKMSSLYKDIEI